MASTLLEKLESKWACPRCDEKRIINTCDTDHFNLHGYRLHYHCLNCGNEFSENEKQEKRRTNKDKEATDQPWTPALFTLMAMVVVIMIINLSERNQRFEPDAGARSQASTQQITRTD